MLKLFTTTKTFFIATFAFLGTVTLNAQVSITTLGSAYNQNFDGLANTGSGFAPVTGWEISEPPSGDDLCDAGDGSSTNHGIYSFGTGSNTDRALGSLTASLNEPMLIGARFDNNTGQNISSIVIQFTGEQWRLGQNSLSDKLFFEYSTDAGSLGAGATWIPISALDFTSPITTGTPGSLDGNLSGNRTTLTANIAVNIPATTGYVYIRWRDQHAGTNDHGLGIDDFSLTAYANLATGTYPEMMVDGTLTLAGDITITGTTNFINGSSKLNIGSNTLTISGDITGTPSIAGGHSSNLVISGTGAVGTINFDQTTPGTSNVLNNLTINRSGATVTLGNALNISDDDGSVNLTAGTLATGGNLTLLSTFTGTARIGTITSGVSDLTGNITAQRYMQGGVLDYRGWRTMGAITSSFNVNQLTDDIFVTGPGGAANGFDANGTNSSVMYYEEDFNASGGRGWKSTPNTSTTFSAGQGMLVFYRGDRTQTSSITNTSIVPNNSTIDVVGSINKGDVVVNLKYNDDANGATEDGWNFIANPYPSQIHWGSVAKGGSVDDNIAVLNPLTNGYVTLGLTDYIPSHQGFFVKANATSQAVTFEENDKVNNGNTPYFKTQVVPFTIKMYEDSIKYDIALLKFEATANKNYVFKEDALKMTNTRVNLGYVTPNGKIVQINTLPNLATNSTDTFIIKTTSIKNGIHWLTFENKTILPANKNVFLVDGFNNNIIDVKVSNGYAFTINNSNSLTFGSRFKLIITDQYSALPVKLTSFTGEKLGEFNLLKWTSVSEKNLINYEIEKSIDGKIFESIGLVKASNSSSTTNYNFVDENSGTNTVNYYRLKINETKGINSYSNIISLSNHALQNVQVDIYPNPAQNNITIKLDESSVFESALIFDMNGKPVLNTSSAEGVDVSSLLPGVYTIQVKTNSAEQKVKFIKQ